MRAKLGRILKTDFFSHLMHVKNYFGSQVMYILINLVSIRIFSSLYTREEYGVLSVYQTYAVILAIVLSLNVYRSTSRYYYEFADDFPEFLGTLVISSFGIYTIGILLFFLSLPVTSPIIGLGTVLPFLLSLTGFNFIMNNIYTQLIIAEKRSAFYSVLRVSNYAISVFVSILAVMQLKEDKYMGQIVATIVVGIAFSLAYLIALNGRMKWVVTKKHLKYIFRYSLPLLPYTLGNIILAQFDRIILKSKLGDADVGVYAMGYNIGNLIFLFISAINASLIPSFYQLQKDHRIQQLEKLIWRSLKLILIVALGMVVGTPYVFAILIDPKFHYGQRVVFPIIIANVFMTYFLFYRMYLDYQKYTSYLSVIAVFGGVSNIIANIILIPIYGIMGAAYSTVISFILLALFARLTLSITYIEIPIFSHRTALISTIIFFLFSFLLPPWLYNADFSLVQITLKAVYIGIFSAILFSPELYSVANQVWKSRLQK